MDSRKVRMLQSRAIRGMDSRKERILQSRAVCGKIPEKSGFYRAEQYVEWILEK